MAIENQKPGSVSRTVQYHRGSVEASRGAVEVKINRQLNLEEVESNTEAAMRVVRGGVCDMGGLGKPLCAATCYLVGKSDESTTFQISCSGRGPEATCALIDDKMRDSAVAGVIRATGINIPKIPKMQ